jgi:hypothetical protein
MTLLREMMPGLVLENLQPFELMQVWLLAARAGKRRLDVLVEGTDLIQVSVLGSSPWSESSLN